jgi:histidine triad (HIT) family protein
MTATFENCVFCQIIQKKASASIIYEDKQVVAFLSNRPVNEGHTLVAPKKHYENIYEIPEEEAAYLFKIAKRIAHAVRDATGAEGIRIVQNNGWAAGQVIFHLHVHIIPLKLHEGFTNGKAFHDPTNLRSAELLEMDAEKVRQHL